MTIYPTVRPSLTLDFQKSKQLDPRITFSRSSSATYVDGGVVKYADEHQARFEDEGLLVEESRTNLVADSASANNWTVLAGGTAAASASVCPDGSTTATRVTGAALNDGAYKTFTAPTPGIHLPTYYARTRTGIATIVKACISGTVGLNVTLPADGSWVRVAGVPNNIGAGNKYLAVLSASAAIDIDVWGLQAELASFPSSYIPTAGSTATRASDVCVITGDNFSSWYNQNEGTIVSTQIDADSGTGYGIVWGFGTGGANRIELRQRNQEFARGFYINGPNIATAPLVYTKTSNAQQYTVGVAIDSSGADYAAEGLGIAGNTFTNATMPDIDKVYIAHGDATDIASKTISRLAYYPERLTDTQLEAITS